MYNQLFLSLIGQLLLSPPLAAVRVTVHAKSPASTTSGASRGSEGGINITTLKEF